MLYGTTTVGWLYFRWICLEIYCNQWGEKLWISSVKLFKLASFSRSYAISKDPFQWKKKIVNHHIHHRMNRWDSALEISPEFHGLSKSKIHFIKFPQHYLNRLLIENCWLSSLQIISNLKNSIEYCFCLNKVN